MPTIKVRPIEESLDFILAYQPSVARFGDGEMDIVAGHGIPYQDYDETLASQLRHIMGQESSENFLVCLSDVFEGRERYNRNFSFFWDGHLERFGHLYEEICKAPWYGSTFISRPYIDLEDKSPAASYFAKLKQIWQDRDVLIVEGETSRSGVGNDLFAQAKSVARIICPSKNAYAHYDEIASAIRQYGKDKLVLLMLGPTAKVLSYNLSREGFWTIDLGHIDSEYEWFLMGATHKVKLHHKHTAEHNYDEGLELAADAAYEAQIVARVDGPLISVIVPVYNVEAYLEECLRSICHQTYRNLEIILIDDGSTDGSAAVYERFAQEDQRIRIFQQENAGLSAARNRGIAEAKGDYLTLVDSDDLIHFNFVSTLIEQLQEHRADIAVSNYYKYSEYDGMFYYHNVSDEGKVEVLTPAQGVYYQCDTVQHIGMAFVTAWGALYKKSLFTEVCFPVGELLEDEQTVHKLYLEANRIVFINHNYYLYRLRKKSIMTDETQLLHRVKSGIRAFELKLTDMLFARLETELMMRRFYYVLGDYKRQLESAQLQDSPEYNLVCQRRKWLGLDS